MPWFRGLSHYLEVWLYGAFLSHFRYLLQSFSLGREVHCLYERKLIRSPVFLAMPRMICQNVCKTMENVIFASVLTLPRNWTRQSLCDTLEKPSCSTVRKQCRCCLTNWVVGEHCWRAFVCYYPHIFYQVWWRRDTYEAIEWHCWKIPWYVCKFVLGRRIAKCGNIATVGLCVLSYQFAWLGEEGGAARATLKLTRLAFAYKFELCQYFCGSSIFAKALICQDPYKVTVVRVQLMFICTSTSVIGKLPRPHCWRMKCAI